jgi:hypothetical protein
MSEDFDNRLWCHEVYLYCSLKRFGMRIPLRTLLDDPVPLSIWAAEIEEEVQSPSFKNGSPERRRKFLAAVKAVFAELLDELAER